MAGSSKERLEDKPEGNREGKSKSNQNGEFKSNLSNYP